MPRNVSINRHEYFINQFPGTAKQKKDFQEWLKQIPWLHPNHVMLWLAEEMDYYLSVDDGKAHYAMVHEALCHIAIDIQNEHSPNATIALPGYGYPLEWMPAAQDHFPVTITNDGRDWTAKALLIRELCMLKVVEEITEKPDWWSNIRNRDIARSWGKEIIALDWSKHMKYADFTSSMALQTIRELKLKADLYEKTGLIPVFDYSACVIKSDTVVSDGLKKAFAGLATELKHVKSYRCIHNGGLLIRQAHTSLCPLVYGRSRILPDRTIKRHNCLNACGEGDILSKPRNTGMDAEYRFRLYDDTYQWLPFDVTISKQGNARIDSYINNLHPVKDKKLYSIISKAINHALPAWDIVYRWPHQFAFQRIRGAELVTSCKTPRICARRNRDCRSSNLSAEASIEYDRRVAARAQRTNKTNATQTGIQAGMNTVKTSECQDYPALSLILEGNESDAIVMPEEPSIPTWFIDKHPIKFPEPDFTDGQYFRLRPSDVKSSGFFSHQNKRIQVMITFAEIQLSPENPEYRGDVWQTDGQLNEHIVSTAMFCYDIENITDSYIYFGAVGDGENLSPGPSSIPEELTYRAFGFLPEENNFQVLGRVRVHPDNAIFYPNVYKHRHGAISLVDRSKTGHLKYFKLYLVDPGIPIISTANVPPQQYGWWTESEIHNQGLGIVQRLPSELKELVHSYVDFPIDGKEEQKIDQEMSLHRDDMGECLHTTPLYDGRFDEDWDEFWDWL